LNFRARLTLTSLLVLAIGLGALLLAGNALLAHRVDQEATDLLRARVQAEIAALSISRRQVLVRETRNDAQLDRDSWVFDHGRVVERPPGVPAALDRAAVALARSDRAAEKDAPGDVRLRVRPLRVGDQPGPVGAVVVALDVAPLERVQQEVLVGSLIIAALVLVAGALAISTAVSGALRPVVEMTTRAEDWGAHDLERRFELGPARDELTGLAATLDHLLSRIAGSRRHEQRFASEVAHELRTPIASLRGRAELALQVDGPEADRERQDALRAVIAQAQRLDATIDALLTIARQEFDEARGEVDLASVIETFDDVDVHMQPGLPHTEGDPDVIQRALAPLVDNARRYARTRVTLDVTADGNVVRIAVRDDGPGIDPAMGERVFDPGVRDSAGPGAGLGLPLARRLALVCGGDVVLGEGAGGCVVLELQAVGGAR
jgi:signal transduction histidine kinase